MTPTGLFSAEYPSIPSLRRAMDAFNDAIRRVGADTGALVVDLDARIPRTLDVFIDDLHTNAAGSAEVARIVFEAIGPRYAERLPRRP